MHSIDDILWNELEKPNNTAGEKTRNEYYASKSPICTSAMQLAVSQTGKREKEARRVRAQKGKRKAFVHNGEVGREKGDWKVPGALASRSLEGGKGKDQEEKQDEEADHRSHYNHDEPNVGNIFTQIVPLISNKIVQSQGEILCEIRHRKASC